MGREFQRFCTLHQQLQSDQTARGEGLRSFFVLIRLVLAFVRWLEFSIADERLGGQLGQGQPDVATDYLNQLGSLEILSGFANGE
jgi:hypothetical protein